MPEVELGGIGSSIGPVLAPLGRSGARVPLAMDDDHAPLFTVGQVCGMLGVQPAFLRRLDAEEIVQPARSDGRHRRYSRQQIFDVEHVLGLTGEGLTLAGVRRVLDLEAHVQMLERQIEQLGGKPSRRRSAVS